MDELLPVGTWVMVHEEAEDREALGFQTDHLYRIERCETLDPYGPQYLLRPSQPYSEDYVPTDDGLFYLNAQDIYVPEEPDLTPRKEPDPWTTR